VNALDHERVVIGRGDRSGLPVIVAVHSTALGQAVGGCRLWRYANWTDGLDDALRLSSAMTLKCAVSGLPLGGGKSVIALPPDVELTAAARRDVLLDLGDVIESLGGSYGAGEDVGTTADDMLTISERTKHVYGLPVATGGMGEPSAPTAVGVYESIRVTCQLLYGSSDLAGRTVTVIGLGQVGSRLASRLRAEGAKLTVTDIDERRRSFASDIDATWVALDEACSTEADLLIPAALGGLLTRELVPSLRCDAIVGPANNQLASDDVADLLAERGILWAPDFLVNAGGVIYGANMEMAKRTPEQAMAAVQAIGTTLHDVYTRSMSERVTPLAAATMLAQDRIAGAAESRTPSDRAPEELQADHEQVLRV
jgi:leucine dehydrogenase